MAASGPASSRGGGANPPVAASDLRAASRVEFGQIKEEGIGADRRGNNKDEVNNAERAASLVVSSSKHKLDSNNEASANIFI